MNGLALNAQTYDHISLRIFIACVTHDFVYYQHFSGIGTHF